ncbi:hypothetical protein BSLA_03f0688 [Burkholderia stabilis]|nr:hypothetical protein BSLA_03f0688 [Burkholderia stabilis]
MPGGQQAAERRGEAGHRFLQETGIGIVGTGRAKARSGRVTGSCGCGTNDRPRRGATAVAIANLPGFCPAV